VRRRALVGLAALACASPPSARSSDAHAVPTEARAPATTVPPPRVTPARYLRTLEYEPQGYAANAAPSDLLLGDLLFHSPLTLGPRAQALGISCNTCHPNGATHPELSLGSLSDRPGNIDLSTAFFRAEAENGVADALNIPSLRGCRYTGPYGHDGRLASLSEFVQGVVHQEFDGEPLSPDSLSALVRYLHDLDFVPNQNLDAHNELGVSASDSARRGQALFVAPRSGFSGKSCANCHPPSSFFRDGAVHRLGSGKPPSPHAIDGGYETPTLLGLAETAPYFHDGRFAEIADVVTWFNRSFSLGLRSEDIADLTAYVTAVGAVDRPRDTRPLAQQLDQVFAFLSLLPARDARIDLAAIEAVRARLQGAPRAVSARAQAAREGLDELARLSAAGDRTQTAARARSLRGELSRLSADWAGAR